MHSSFNGATRSVEQSKDKKSSKHNDISFMLKRYATERDDPWTPTKAQSSSNHKRKNQRQLGLRS